MVVAEFIKPGESGNYARNDSLLEIILKRGKSPSLESEKLKLNLSRS